MRKDYDKEFIEIDTAPLSIGSILKMAQHNIGNTTYTDALLLYAYNCNPTDHYILGFVAQVIKQRRFNQVSLLVSPMNCYALINLIKPPELSIVVWTCQLVQSY